MSPRHSAAEASRARIESADRASRKPARRAFGGIHTDINPVHLPRPVRTAVLPEPVEVPRMVNGRRLEPWERVLYREWAHRERRRELAMFTGLIG